MRRSHRLLRRLRREAEDRRRHGRPVVAPDACAGERRLEGTQGDGLRRRGQGSEGGLLPQGRRRRGGGNQASEVAEPLHRGEAGQARVGPRGLGLRKAAEARRGEAGGGRREGPEAGRLQGGYQGDLSGWWRGSLLARQLRLSLGWGWAIRGIRFAW